MADISAWNSTAASNNSVSPDGFPEQMLPSGVNDSAREVMAAIRRWYEDAQWINLGHTPTQASATTFTIPTDVTAIYEANRRIKMYGSTMGTFYGTISSSSYSAPNTTVNITMDSGSLTSNLSKVYVGALTATNSAVPRGTGKFTDLTVSGTTTLGTMVVNSSGEMTAGTVPLARIAYTGTITTTSISGGGAANNTITHGLGGDDVYIIAFVTGSVDENWGMYARRVDGTTTSTRGRLYTSAYGISPTAPSTGDVTILIHNASASAQTFTIKYVVFGYA